MCHTEVLQKRNLQLIPIRARIYITETEYVLPELL